MNMFSNIKGFEMILASCFMRNSGGGCANIRFGMMAKCNKFCGGNEILRRHRLKRQIKKDCGNMLEVSEEQKKNESQRESSSNYLD
jgi:hypothetical protein